MTEIQNLWPQGLKPQETITPYAILKAQVEKLETMTDGRVSAVVQQTNESVFSGGPLSRQIAAMFNPDIVYVNFHLTSPFIKNYRYHLFEVSHRLIPMFPITISYINSDVRMKMIDEKKLDLSKIEVGNIQDFTEAVRGIFSNERTLLAISSLASYHR